MPDRRTSAQAAPPRRLEAAGVSRKQEDALTRLLKPTAYKRLPTEHVERIRQRAEAIIAGEAPTNRPIAEAERRRDLAAAELADRAAGRSAHR